MNSFTGFALSLPRIRPRCPDLRRFVAISLCAAGLGIATAVAAAETTDGRLTYGADSPHWLRAVGRLRVPGLRRIDGRNAHLVEDCSATLVAPPGARSSDIIVTAWHCLEDYRDLSREIVFTLLPGTADSHASEAVRLETGGSMHADWAILRLRQPVPAELVRPLQFNPLRADPERGVAMAGYSRDLGEGGERLSYDPQCRVLNQPVGSSHTDCAAAKGASGGAVVQSGADGVARLTGVISAGDGAGFSVYVPVAGFRAHLARLLQ